MLIYNKMSFSGKVNKVFVTSIVTAIFLLGIANFNVSAENPPVYKTTHKVAKGESLSIISRKYECTIEDIKKWNDLPNDLIHPGQILHLTPLKENDLVKITRTYYKVKSGDCLSSIALKNHCSVENIKKWNNLKSTKLSLGQKLIVSKKETKILADTAVIKVEEKLEVKTLDTNYHKRIIEFTEEQKIDSLISYAHLFIGRPYHSRMENFIFDCSGYVSFLFSKFGVTLPRSSPAQAVLGEHVDIKDLRKGDLVFFNGHKRNKRVGHVGMVISADGNDFTMIHSSTRRGIVIETFRGNPYFEKRYVTARRIVVPKS